VKIRENEPSFDVSRHRSKKELTDCFSESKEPRSGCIKLIVQRQADGSRQTPREAMLCEEDGLIGDRWAHDPKRKRVEQIAIMDWRIASVIANEQSLTLFGDNVFLDWDIGVFTIGQRFLLGEAILEVTTEPHNGCAKFAMRFGAPALKWTCQNREEKRRGIYAYVIQRGKVQVGDTLKMMNLSRRKP